MGDISNTQYFKAVQEDKKLEVGEVLREVYEALTEKGYNPINQIVGYLLSFQVLVRIFNGVIDNGEDLLRDLLACHAIACLELFPSLLVDPSRECLPRYCGKFEDAFYRDALQVECLRRFFGFMFRSCHTGRLKFETKMRISGADRKK